MAKNNEAYKLAQAIYESKDEGKRAEMQKQLQSLAKESRNAAQQKVKQDTRQNLQKLEKQQPPKPVAGQERLNAAKANVAQQKTATEKLVRSQQGNMNYWRNILTGKNKDVMAGKSAKEQEDLMKQAKKAMQGATENLERYGDKSRQLEKTEQGLKLMEGQARQIAGGKGNEWYKQSEIESRVKRAEEWSSKALKAEDIYRDVVTSHQINEAAGDKRDAVRQATKDVVLTGKDAKNAANIATLNESVKKDLEIRSEGSADMGLEAASFLFRRNKPAVLEAGGKSYEIDPLTSTIYELGADKKRAAELSDTEAQALTKTLLASKGEREKAADVAYRAWWDATKDLQVPREIRLAAMKNIFDRTSPFAAGDNLQALNDEMTDLVNRARISNQNAVLKPQIDDAYKVLIARGVSMIATPRANFDADLLKTLKTLQNKSQGEMLLGLADFTKKYGLKGEDVAKYIQMNAPLLAMAAGAATRGMLSYTVAGLANTSAGIDFWSQVLKDPSSFMKKGGDLVLDVAPVTGTVREYNRAMTAFESGDIMAGVLHSGFTVLSGGLDTVTLVPAATGVLAAPALAANVGLRTMVTTILKNGAIRVTEEVLSKEALQNLGRGALSAGTEAVKALPAAAVSLATKNVSMGTALRYSGELAKKSGVTVLSGLKDATLRSAEQTARTTANVMTLGAADWMHVVNLARQGKMMTPEAGKLLAQMAKNAPHTLPQLRSAEPLHTTAKESAARTDEQLVAEHAALAGRDEAALTSAEATLQQRENASKTDTTVSNEQLLRDHADQAGKDQSANETKQSPRRQDARAADNERLIRENASKIGKDDANARQSEEKAKDDFESRMKEAREHREKQEQLEKDRKAAEDRAREEERQNMQKANEIQDRERMTSDADVTRIRKTKDSYAVLGVDPRASSADIQKAYRKLARTIHPDTWTTPKGREFATKLFQRLEDAKSTLLDERKRRTYDARRRAAR